MPYLSIYKLCLRNLLLHQTNELFYLMIVCLVKNDAYLLCFLTHFPTMYIIKMYTSLVIDFENHKEYLL